MKGIMVVVVDLMNQMFSILSWVSLVDCCWFSLLHSSYTLVTDGINSQVARAGRMGEGGSSECKLLTYCYAFLTILSSMTILQAFGKERTKA